MSNQFHRHYHLGVEGTPSVTCFVVEQEEEKNRLNLSYVSFAICNPADNFSRAKGRMISRNRYNADKYIEVERCEDNFLIEDLLEALEIHLFNKNDEFHERVYEVLSYYYYNPEAIMEGMESQRKKRNGFFFDKVLPFLSKFRIFQRMFYGI